SRALFLYSFSPLAIASWVTLSKVRLGKALRAVQTILAAAVLVIAWLVMSATRAQNVREYEGAFENIQAFETAKGAFDIYSSAALIVRYFPDQIDYEYGKSLIPLAMGWVPRSVWQD